MTEPDEYRRLILPTEFPPTYGGLLCIREGTILPTGHLTTRKIHIIDYRYMKILLADLFARDPTDLVAAIISVALGLCSLRRQAGTVAALAALYDPTSPVEQKGVRLRESSLDTFVDTFLREIFAGIADGYVAPSMYPADDESFDILPSSLTLFSPADSGCIQPHGSATILSARPLNLRNIVWRLRPYYESVFFNKDCKHYMRLLYVNIRHNMQTDLSAAAAAAHKWRNEYMSPNIFEELSPSHQCYSAALVNL